MNERTKLATALKENERLRDALEAFAEAWTAAAAQVDLCATPEDITAQAAAGLTHLHFIKACAALETTP